MSEYIERDAAIKARGHSYDRKCAECDFAIEGDSWCKGKVFVVDLLRIPAADVRPVVMCRDCEYWKQWDNTTHYLCTYVAGAKFIRNAEDFCSRGAKREES